MPPITHLSTFTNVGGNLATKLFYQEASRVAVTIHVPSNETDGCEIYDTQPESTNNNFFIRLFPGDTLFLSAIDGHDLSQSYYARKINAGTLSVRVQEEFLDPTITDKLIQKGVTTTQGLPFILLALMAVSQ